MFKKPFGKDWPITQRFGENVEVYKRFGLLTGHNGLDYGCPTGTAVLAAGEGTVLKVGNDPQGYGVYLLIDHKDGYTTLYGHLKRVVTDKGFTVNQGQQIGDSDSTGFSTGPHLHFEVRLFGVAMDPERVLEGETPTPALPPKGGGSGGEGSRGAGSGVIRAVVAVEALNVRTGPGLNYPILRQLAAGDIVQVVEFEGPVLWVQLTTGEFCAFRWNGTDYLRPC